MSYSAIHGLSWDYIMFSTPLRIWQEKTSIKRRPDSVLTDCMAKNCSALFLRQSQRLGQGLLGLRRAHYFIKKRTRFISFNTTGDIFRYFYILIELQIQREMFGVSYPSETVMSSSSTVHFRNPYARINARGFHVVFGNGHFSCVWYRL